MYICICNAISERQVREVVDRGAHSLSEVQAHLPIASCCGTCSESAAEIVDEHVQQKLRGCRRSAA